MATKITNEDILQINSLYFQYKTYAEVARQTGFSASTVKKYVIKDWKPVNTEAIVHFDIAQLPDYTVAAELFRGISNYGTLCVLTEHEQEEIKKLWEELAV